MSCRIVDESLFAAAGGILVLQAVGQHRFVSWLWLGRKDTLSSVQHMAVTHNMQYRSWFRNPPAATSAAAALIEGAKVLDAHAERTDSKPAVRALPFRQRTQGGSGFAQDGRRAHWRMPRTTPLLARGNLKNGVLFSPIMPE